MSVFRPGLTLIRARPGSGVSDLVLGIIANETVFAAEHVALVLCEEDDHSLQMAERRFTSMRIAMRPAKDYRRLHSVTNIANTTPRQIADLVYNLPTAGKAYILRDVSRQFHTDTQFVGQARAILKMTRAHCLYICSTGPLGRDSPDVDLFDDVLTAYDPRPDGGEKINNALALERLGTDDRMHFVSRPAPGADIWRAAR
jgi:hypothetical protein